MGGHATISLSLMLNNLSSFAWAQKVTQKNTATDICLIIIFKLLSFNTITQDTQ